MKNSAPGGGGWEMMQMIRQSIPEFDSWHHDRTPPSTVVVSLVDTAHLRVRPLCALAVSGHAGETSLCMFLFPVPHQAYSCRQPCGNRQDQQAVLTTQWPSSMLCLTSNQVPHGILMKNHCPGLRWKQKAE